MLFVIPLDMLSLLRDMAFLDLRDKRPHLFDSAQTDAMVLFMWQDDMIGVVRFIDECLERILYTSDQP